MKLQVLIIDRDQLYAAQLTQRIVGMVDSAVVRQYHPGNPDMPGMDFDWKHYDLVILEDSMSESAGYEWLKNVKDRPGFPPYVFISDEEVGERIASAVKNGAFDFVARGELDDYRLRAIMDHAIEVTNSRTKEIVSLRFWAEQCDTLPEYISQEDITHDAVSPVISHFRVMKELGRGGMGIVYHAHDQRYKTDVALKVLDTRVTHDELHAMRFVGEASMISQIHHPQVIKIHEQGFTDDYAWLAMELLPGGTLKQQISHGLPMEQALNYMAQLSSAVNAVHAHGVIHGDIKPSNILFKGPENLVLADFGISRASGTPSVASRSGTSVGTPAYMSPEHFQGVETDERSDVYSMGVIFYEMLSGHLPYEASSLEELKQLHLNASLPAIPDVPERVMNLVRGLMAKRPEDRVNSAMQIGVLLNSFGLAEVA